MDLEEIKTTDLWDLYEQGRDYCRSIKMFTDTDENYRMYNGNQWEGLIIKGIEPIQLNFIKPIVKYKVGNLNANLWSINYSSENFENKYFRETANKTCDMLNLRAHKIWEKDNLDYKVRRITKDAAINDEGIIYVTYDEENGMPINEIISKNDIFYGNENDSNIQNQPYILIKRRLPVYNVQEKALLEGVPEEKLKYIIGDNDNFEESGESSKYEKDNMCTIVTKMYKENGTVHYSSSTKYLEIKKDTDTGLTLYPVAHMVWEEKEGSARGEGEVRNLKANQIEVNKILMRSSLVVKLTAYQTKIVNKDKISNPNAINQVGATLYTKGGMTVEDVNKVVGYIPPAQMSPDVEKLRTELIKSTRELAGAGDVATGDINPETASGKAILAVQQASQMPLVEQLSSLKTFVEDIARIWLDHITTYSQEGITLENEVSDPATGEEYTELVKVPSTVLEELKASVKVDITPKGAFDKYAQELTLENFFKAGMFNVQKLSELEIYVKLLDNDSTAPKPKLEEAIKLMKAEQQKIAMIQAQAQLMQQQAEMFINSDPEAQASQINDAQAAIQQEEQAAALEPTEEELPITTG